MLGWWAVRLLSAKALVAVALVAAGWIYHKGAMHEREQVAREALRTERRDMELRERTDESVLDAIRNGTLPDRLRSYYRD